MLKIKGLRKSFGKTEVLKGIDLEIKEGEVVVIVGPSGGGKTTLLRCINALEKADEGEIIINNKIFFQGKKVIDKNEFKSI